MTSWQPISTAPRDSAIEILVWDGKSICVARPFGKNSWMIADSYGFNEDGEIPHVTHWLPLPEPPR